MDSILRQELDSLVRVVFMHDVHGAMRSPDARYPSTVTLIRRECRAPKGASNMGVWKWVKEKVVGEVIHDYGQVLEWTHMSQTTRLHLQLSHEEGRFFLFTRTTSSAFLSKHVVFSRIEVTEGELERMRETLADAATRIRSKRAELARH